MLYLAKSFGPACRPRRASIGRAAGGFSLAIELHFMIEHATIAKVRTVPEWVRNAIEAELVEARSITCPRARRLREIEIDLKRDAIREGTETRQCF